MRSFRLDVPAFEFSSRSKLHSMVYSKDDNHFVPHFSIHFMYKAGWSRETSKTLLNLIESKFGYIPFGSVDGGKGFGFRFRQFFDSPIFVKQLAALLQEHNYISAADEKKFLAYFDLYKDQLQSFYQDTKKCHDVPAQNLRLHKAVKGGDYAEVELLLSDPTIDINAQDGYGHTPLFLAVRLIPGRPDLVKLLLSLGSNPHIASWFGDRPLDSASYTNKLEIAQLLLEYRADPNLFWGSSAMHNAFAMASDKMVALLARYGARWDLKDQFGVTAASLIGINGRHHDNGVTVKRRIQIASSNYQASSKPPSLFGSGLGNITSDYAFRYYLLPVKVIIEEIITEDAALIPCIKRLLQSNLDFSALTRKERSALEDLEGHFLYHKEEKCSDREHEGWFKAALLESLFEKTNDGHDESWLIRNRIAIRAQISNSLPLAPPKELLVDKKGDSLISPESRLTTAQASLLAEINKLVNLDWQEFTRVGTKPNTVEMMSLELRYTDISVQTSLATCIENCKKKEPKTAGFTHTLFSKYLRGRNDFTILFYQTVGKVHINSIPSLEKAAEILRGMTRGISEKSDVRVKMQVR